MLIRNAEVWGRSLADIRLRDTGIAAIGALPPLPGEPVLDAEGGALLPGLHDHHIHLAGLAARGASIWCGPPEVQSAGQLVERLRQPGDGWIRGIGYHESVMGLPGARDLDRIVAARPLRVQHRSGRMWLLNSAALAELLSRADPPPGLERDAAGFTGRLFDEDRWLRETLHAQPPDFTEAARELARHGITGITDMSPANDPAMAGHFARQMAQGALPQHCRLAGALSLASADPGPWELGPAKLHLHEAALPDFDDTVRLIGKAREQRRAVAVHCVSEVELVFALAAFEAAGAMPGDRIEHASIASPDLVARIAALGLAVCVQPHFVAERGDRYLIDVEPRHLPDLYRLRSLADAGIALAGGSDAPFVSADPWAAMRAAVRRKTCDGRTIGAQEALSPEAALDLYLRAPEDLARQRRIAPGENADLCLLDRPWNEARTRLDARDVRAVLISGRFVHHRIDEAPGQGMANADPPAG